MKEVAALIERAARSGIELKVSDFRVVDGGLTLDGVPADQWVDAMTMDDEEDPQ